MESTLQLSQNGLWIKDKIDEKIIITNSSSIDGKFNKNFITEFDEDYNVIRNIQSNKIDISKKEWKIIEPTIYKQNNYENKDIVYVNTNFDSESSNLVFKFIFTKFIRTL